MITKQHMDPFLKTNSKINKTYETFKTQNSLALKQMYKIYSKNCIALSLVIDISCFNEVTQRISKWGPSFRLQKIKVASYQMSVS